MPDSSPFVALRRRVVTSVTRHFFVRWHMALIFTGVVLSGVVASKLLLVAGLRWMALRYVLAVVCSYLVFFLLVRLWLAYIALARPPALDSERPRAGGSLSFDFSTPGSDLPTQAALEPGGGGFGGGGASAGFDDVGAPEAGHAAVGGVLSGGHAPDARDGSGGFGVDLDEGVAVLLVFLLLLTVIGGVGLYLVLQAPEILAEAAFQMVFAAALGKASRKLDVVGWGGSVFRATRVAFVLVLVLAGAFGWVAQHHCPRVTRLGEVFFGCLLEP